MNRILLVDDDDVIRNTVKTYLSRCGYDVLTACDGLEAVEVFQSFPDLIDLVLTDLRMPVMSGGEAVRQIWNLRPEAKVICMTGCSDDACPKGAVFLEKPFKFEVLRALVRESLESDGRHRAKQETHAETSVN